MAKRVKIGSVLKRKAKDGSDAGVYIKISKEVTLKEGSFVNVEDPRELPGKLLAMGKIDNATYEEMQTKADALPDFVLSNLTITEQ